ncbi:MAG: rod shape-determining protein MreC [Anaeromyxobacter sp.]|nr:rod shape-determining protein MreC [Anaeromyxobacter sp.]MBL0274693.1 rod shape-determining protein MreC [Anaeromyxobacter sp.]
MLALLRRYRELILVAVLLLFPLAVFFAHAARPGERSRVDQLLLAVTAPLEKVVAAAVTGTLDAWSGYLALRGAHERAAALTRENRQLTLERQALLQEKAENDRLRRLLSLAEAEPPRSYLGARVIGVRMAPAGLQLITLDKGADAGLARGMPVVVADGVVGRVHATAGGSADVLLAVDRNSSIAVRVERTRARANVRGLGRPDLGRLDYALRSEDVIEGDLLVTSGTDAVFPAGLPVGRATRLVRSTQGGLFLEGSVLPAVDPTRLEEVLVITSGARDLLPAAALPGALP